MIKPRPNILSIGGFDPSGGAGILADTKTAEQLKCYAYAVQTANTIQTKDTFESVNWSQETIFFKQLKITLNSTNFKAIKIGLIPFDWLEKTISIIEKNTTNSFIIWDPILKTSSGFDFNQPSIFSFIKRVNLITPNWEEISFFGSSSPIENAKLLSEKTNIFLKGGHAKNVGKDYLFTNNKIFNLNPKNQKFYEKHGSGCILSSAISSYIARKFSLLKSCFRAKRYVERILSSNPTKLGYHK